MNEEPVPRISARELLRRYDCLLLDAYGVLLSHDHALPGADAFLAHLNASGKPYFIVTNDASRSAATSAARYRGMGLEVPPDRILTSAMALVPHFREKDLVGARCLVLGPEDSEEYVRQAGGTVVPWTEEPAARVLVVCDERGYPLRERLDQAITFLYRKVDAKEPVDLVLANPDLVYPAASGRYGFTAGALALVLEEALAQRYPRRRDLRFARLGKPFPPLFQEAARRAGTRSLVMIGDQLGTDVLGANRFGMDSVLVTGGLTHLDHADFTRWGRPTWILESLRLD